MKVLLFFSSHRQLEEIHLSSRFFNLTKHLRHVTDVMVYCDNDSISEEKLRSHVSYATNTFIIKGKQIFPSNTWTGISGNGIHIGLASCFERFKDYDYVINMVPDCYITDDSEIWKLLQEEMDSDNNFIVDYHPLHNSTSATQFPCDFFVFKPKNIPNIFSEVDMNNLIPPENYIYNKILEHQIKFRTIQRIGSLTWQIDNYGLIHNHDVNTIRTILSEVEQKKQTSRSTVVIGGTGILGRELSKLSPDLVCLNSEYDVFEFNKLRDLLLREKPSTIIHCAAIKSEKVDQDPTRAMNVNIIGTCNIAKHCIENNVRLVYISTDYVYPGVTGNYSETDSVFPQNKYAWTKLAGEAAAALVDDHLIIRTSFGEEKFPYPKAFDNLFVSKDYVDIIAPMVLSVSLSSEKGIINIGTERKSLFDFANRRNVVEAASIPVAKDFSLNMKRFHTWKTDNRIQ